MRVEVRLYATLSDKYSDRKAGEPIAFHLGEGTRLSDLLVHLKIPPDDVHLAIVNGRAIHNYATPLTENDRVGLFPPVGGG